MNMIAASNLFQNLIAGGIPVSKLRFDLRRYADCNDPREVPAYSIPEAARYLQIPTSTLRSWVVGRDYTIEKGRGKRRFKPVIQLPDTDLMLLSFFNVAEAHVLGAFRREHKISLRHIRSALNYVTKQYGWKRPLIDQEFKTDGVGLLVEKLGRFIDVSAKGQVVMKKVVQAHLRRLEWEDKLVSKLYPFTRAREFRSPKLVLMDPRYSYGRPILRKSHIATAIIAERYKAGDSIGELADDYACERLEIEEAIRCELHLKTAA